MSWDNCNATASPPIDAPPVMYVVQWTEEGALSWYYEQDDDGTPAMFWQERDAMNYVKRKEAEITEDGEPTPYRYRIIEEWEEESPYCPECDTSFATEDDMDIHARRHG